MLDPFDTLAQYERPKCFEGVQGAKYYLIQSMPQFRIFMEKLIQQRLIAIDTETSGLKYPFFDVCGISIGWGIENNYYLPINHKTKELQLNIEDIIESLKLVFENESISKTTWNIKFDALGFHKLGLKLKGIVYDAMTNHHLIDENDSHALKDQSVKRIHKDADKWEKVIYEWRMTESRRRRSEFQKLLKVRRQELEESKELIFDPECKAKAKELAKEELKDHSYAKNGKDDITYDYIPLELMTPYACADVHYTFALHKQLILELPKDLRSLYRNELSLSDVLLSTEIHGIKIDIPYLQELGPKYEKEVEECKKEVFNYVGYEFNIASTEELSKALQTAGVVLTKPTKASKEALDQGIDIDVKYSTDSGVLEKLAVKYEFAQKLLKYREVEKLRGTYVEGMLKLADTNGYVHTSYRSNVSTGRMGSSEPNLQNIPAGSVSIKKAFVVPSSEYKYVCSDLSQIELRLCALFSQDENMLSCYPWEGKGVDIHTLTAANIILDKSYDEALKMEGDKSLHSDSFLTDCECANCLFKDARKKAKTTNFSIIYLTTARTLAMKLSTPKKVVSEETCQEYINGYFNLYPGVKELVRQVKRQLIKFEYIQNPYGRYRRFPGYNKLKGWQKERCPRQALNYLIQSTAADLFKHSIVKVHGFLLDNKAKTRIVNYVHDDMQFYFHKEELDLLPQIKNIIETVTEFECTVPIKTEIAISDTDWSTTEKV